MRFADRADAGRRLADALAARKDDQPVVLGLPRGGVAVAAPVAAALHAPLDVIVVRKLGVPRQPELAMGAIGEGGVRVLNERVMLAVAVSAADLAAVEARERAELERRLTHLRQGRSAVELAGRVAILVDDGLATGATAMAACEVAPSARCVGDRDGRPGRRPGGGGAAAVGRRRGGVPQRPAQVRRRGSGLRRLHGDDRHPGDRTAQPRSKNLTRPDNAAHVS